LASADNCACMKKAVENWAPKKLAPAENRAAEKKRSGEEDGGGELRPTNSASAENCASDKEAVENCVPSKRA
jgi:hypothetical protein